MPTLCKTEGEEDTVTATAVSNPNEPNDKEEENDEMAMPPKLKFAAMAGLKTTWEGRSLLMSHLPLAPLCKESYQGILP